MISTTVRYPGFGTIPLAKLDRKMIRRLRDQLLIADPDRFVMASWVGTGEEFVPESKCGTTACLAGWTVGIVDGVARLKDDTGIGARAAELIRVPNWTSALFFKMEWPLRYQHLALVAGEHEAAIAVLNALLAKELGICELSEADHLHGVRGHGKFVELTPGLYGMAKYEKGDCS